jgi:hypothetical protein
VSAGNLYLLRATAGDKRWFKGADKVLTNIQASFSVA